MFHTNADAQEAQALAGEDFLIAFSGYMESIGEEECNAIETELGQYMARIVEEERNATARSVVGEQPGAEGERAEEERI